MAKKKLTPKDRQALDVWNELVASIKESSDIDPSDSVAEIEARKSGLKRMTKHGSSITSLNITPVNRPISIRRLPPG